MKSTDQSDLLKDVERSWVRQGTCTGAFAEFGFGRSKPTQAHASPECVLSSCNSCTNPLLLLDLWCCSLPDVVLFYLAVECFHHNLQNGLLLNLSPLRCDLMWFIKMLLFLLFAFKLMKHQWVSVIWDLPFKALCNLFHVSVPKLNDRCTATHTQKKTRCESVGPGDSTGAQFCLNKCHIWIHLTYLTYLTWLRAEGRCRFKCQWPWRRHTSALPADFGSSGRLSCQCCHGLQRSPEISRYVQALHMSPARTVSCSSCQGQGASVLCTACQARIGCTPWCCGVVRRIWFEWFNHIQPGQPLGTSWPLVLICMFVPAWELRQFTLHTPAPFRNMECVRIIMVPKSCF